MNRILLVYGELRHGGIQTLIVRLANHLASQGRPVAACIPGGELAGLLGAGVDALTWAKHREAVALAADWIGREKSPVTLVSFDPISAALGLAIEARNAGRTPLVHVSGVYHPRSFFMTGERRDRVLLNRLVAKAVGDPLIYYMNVECRDTHARRWGVKLDTAAIIPLPIEERASQWQPAPSQSLRIISVGRFTDFKAYNLAAAAIVRECHDAGIDVRWDIFGWGPLEQAMRDSVARANIGDRVRIAGRLPYEEFAATVAGHDLFVGMGTAALEAAMVGVPAIVATESELRRTYGFVSDLPFGNVGERQGVLPPHDLGDLIRAYSAMPPEERRAISRRCRQAVLGYSYAHFVEQLDLLAAQFDRRPSLGFKRIVSSLYASLTSGPLASAARRMRGADHANGG